MPEYGDDDDVAVDIVGMKLLPQLAVMTVAREYDLSHKLLCYIRISGLERSRHNTREKIFIFSRVDIANQLLTHHSLLAPLGQVDE